MKNNLFLIIVWILIPSSVFAEFTADFQGGPVFTEYNDVRISGENGTRFSLSNDLKAETAWSFRTEASTLSHLK